MRVPLFSSGSNKLAIREKDDFSQITLAEDNSSFDLYPIHSETGHSVLAKIQPPREPEQQIHHVPCDIVLVIDVSGSMGTNAPMPADENGNSESTGLSVLDLVKHAALTIIETLDERDRLGIVTFASSVDVVQKLKPMTKEGKTHARNNIKKMRPKDATNLWHGIVNGIKLFQESDSNGKVPAVMVLTDGMPNHMCPHSGYVPKLRTMMPLPATIHTFGFGYSLRSGLLKSIAEIGNGNYAFIPDAGMIGTVFVHAVANLQSTYATEAKLALTYGSSMQLEPAEGKNLLQKDRKPQNPFGKSTYSTTIQLGNIQYDQSRDILLDAVKLNHSETDASRLDIEAELSFNIIDLASSTTQPVTMMCRRNVMDKSTLDLAEIAYHQSRSQICRFLSDLFPLNSQDEHISICKSHHDDERTKLHDSLRLFLLKDIPARNYDDAFNNSITADLDGPEPSGQISMAIGSMDFWFRWGQHYLPSLWNAYSRQICNSFKDQGPLQFGTDSPLFISCRDRLDTTFDNLPPPEPSLTIQHMHRAHGAVGGRCAPTGTSSLSSFTMRSYRNASAGCFAASTMVELASGRSVEIKRLRRGFKIRTPMGSRKVAAVIKFPVQNISIYRVGNILVTPWHPISLDGKSWTFPAYAADSTARYTGAVYSVVLQRDRSPDAHAMRLDGIWGVTMGHGIMSGGDARAHAFFGDYVLVGKSLVRIGMDPRGVAVSGGVQRDDRTGLVVGFEDGKISQVSRVSRVAQALRM